ncbi:hypothetical protein EDB83DRAFT_2422495 [Lactarius deliciosus]|nr:hypothetical protein EDB83DRAFT_2422495 [Lactarius deliciosus]
MSADHSSPAIDAKALETATDIHVFDKKGGKVRFGDIFNDQKTIVVFIRHFFCGSCMQYVSQLATVRADALEEASTKIIVVGCGDWSLIEGYQSTPHSPRTSSTYDRPAPFVENTGFKGELYANPDRKLYDTLGLVSNLQTTPKGEERRSYLTRSLLSGTLWSIWRGPLKNPLNLGKQGNISQNGGDFVFGPGASCSYSSRMKHTEDHVEVSELMKAAGVSYP